MGGSSSKESKKQKIENKINSTIKSSNETLTELITTTINNSSTEIQNSQAAQIKSNNAISQNVEIDEIRISGKNSKANISADITNKIQALVNISNDTTLMTQLLNDVDKKLKSSIAQKQDLTESLAAISKLNEEKKDGGGPEQMVAKAMEALDKISGNLTGKESDQEVETQILNQMGMTMETVSKILTKTNDTVSNNISAAIKNITEFKCESVNDLSQRLKSRLLEVTDGGEYNQTASIKNFSECIFKAINGSSIINDVTGLSKQDIDNAASAAQSGSAGMTVSSDITNKDENKSAIMESINNLVNNVSNMLNNLVDQPGKIIIAIGIICALIIIASIASSAFMFIRPKSNNNLNTDYPNTDYTNTEYPNTEY